MKRRRCRLRASSPRAKSQSSNRWSASSKARRRNRRTRNPKGSLAWAAWGVARLGGWNGYGKERPPGPVTFARGLRRFHAIAEGFALAANNSNNPH
jgi:hypothetical protein